MLKIFQLLVHIINLNLIKIWILKKILNKLKMYWIQVNKKYNKLLLIFNLPEVMLLFILQDNICVIIKKKVVEINGIVKLPTMENKVNYLLKVIFTDI